MPFFPVDDEAPFHRKIIAAGNAAVGLWARAGGFCMKEATDGMITRDELATMGTPGQAKKLVEVRLWHAHGHDCPRCPQPPKGGWIFHDWTETGPIKTSVQIKARREADKERQRRHRASQPSQVRHAVTDGVTSGVTHDAPSPSPSVVTSSSQSPQVTRGHGLTDDELTKIEQRLGCDKAHAARVAARVFSKVKPGVAVAKRLRYVLAAIEDDPKPYLPTATAGQAEDHCSKHPGRSKNACGGCAADARAVN